MSEHGGKPPSDVLRTKRLEIVDDEGKARAVLGTDEEGITSLSLFEPSGRLRTTLDAEERPDKASGLGVFDTNGNLRVAAGMDNDPAKRSFFNLYDTEGNHRVVVSLDADGQAGLRFSAGKKDRAIGIAAEDEGNLILMLTEDDTPMVGLGVTEGEGKDLSSELVLVDEDGRSGVVLRGGKASPRP